MSSAIVSGQVAAPAPQVNTERFNYIPQGMLHLEGGWPKDVDSTEKDQTTRFRKKIEKDDEYIKQVRSLGDMVEGDIKQNYAIDIYQEYFAGEYVDHSSEAPSAKTLSVFKDPSEVKRTVANISWYPDGGKKLAVAFAIMQFQDPRAEQATEFSYIWDVNNPNTPELQLTPASPLCSLRCLPLSNCGSTIEQFSAPPLHAMIDHTSSRSIQTIPL